MSISISAFNCDTSSRFDMARAVVVSEGFRFLKETGFPLASWDKVPTEVVENLEKWEVVDEIYVDDTYFDEYEGKWEYGGSTKLLIAPLVLEELPEFWEFFNKAYEMGFSEYAA